MKNIVAAGIMIKDSMQYQHRKLLILEKEILSKNG